MYMIIVFGVKGMGDALDSERGGGGMTYLPYQRIDQRQVVPSGQLWLLLHGGNRVVECRRVCVTFRVQGKNGDRTDSVDKPFSGTDMEESMNVQEILMLQR